MGNNRDYILIESRGGKTDRWNVFDCRRKRVLRGKLQKGEAVEMFNELNGIRKVVAKPAVVVVRHPVKKTGIWIRVKKFFRSTTMRLRAWVFDHMRWKHGK
jgi:hypothetical protein